MPKLLALLSKPAFLLLLLAVVGLSGGYMYMKYRAAALELDKFKTDPQSIAAEEAQTLIADVGNLTNLPENEQPTVATVTNVDALRDQAFFAQAENGDKVLIYTEAKRAILYRPSTKKIIEIAPLNIGSQTETVEGATSEAPAALKVAFYNGTATSGVAGTAADDVSSKLTGYEIDTGIRADAKNSYEGSVVVDLSNANADLAAQIAELVGGTVGGLPEGETAPNADILVLVGSSYSKE